MRKLLIILIAFFFITIAHAQKRPLDLDGLVSWQVVKGKYISNDGRWAVVYSKPYRGDSRLIITTTEGSYYRQFIGGYSPKISPDNNFIAFLVKPRYELVRELKLEGEKKSALPKDSAYVFFTADKKLVGYDSINKILVPKDQGSGLALMRFYPGKNKDKVYRLIILRAGNNTSTYDSVSEAVFACNGSRLAFVQLHKDTSSTTYSVRVFDLSTAQVTTIAQLSGKTRSLALSDRATLLAFLSTQDTTEQKVYSLYVYDLVKNKEIKVIDTATVGIPEGMALSQYSKVYFSANDARLFFGLAPKPKAKAKDTVPEDEKVKLDLWSWTDSILMPAQLVRLEKDKKFSYVTVYDLKKDKVVRVQANRYTTVKFYDRGNGRYALERDPSPYLKLQSWDYPWWADYYIVDLMDGSKVRAARKIAGGYLSPDGEYFVYYNHRDSSWYSFVRREGRTVRLTDNSQVSFYNEENDAPAPAGPYGFGGFSPQSKLCFIYDKYDIWAVDPSGKKEAYNLTGGFGRKNNLVLRIVDLNKEDEYVAPEEVLFKAFDKETKDAGFFAISGFSPHSSMTKLIMTANYYSDPIKARSSDRLIWQKSDVRTYPDLWTSDTRFGQSRRLTHFIDQQKPYIWANVELVKWITTDGSVEEGLLFKPENFDPSGKYPMIVYYYEQYSDLLHRYFMPRPSRSIINPIHYASNGYIVFIPNIRYKVGMPGMSAYNYVISGTLALLERYSWIDSKRLGLQGQSWGGYETAFIITQTSMFAAAEAGAPVSNMTSAYGGIRWQTGLSRMFQYEKTQSRIGKDLWNGLPLYLYNSPVFYAPYIKTPLLIMHNDHDGAVPWYQGIELFVALRRLNKPVWLMNYNGEPHNLREGSSASVDLTKRMMQFFDHYLKDSPMPDWMKYGRPALMKQ